METYSGELTRVRIDDAFETVASLGEKVAAWLVLVAPG